MSLVREHHAPVGALRPPLIAAPVHYRVVDGCLRLCAHRDRGRGALRPELPAVRRPASSPRAAIWFSRRELGPAADVGEADRPTPLPPGPARSTRPRAAEPAPGPGAGRAGASAVDDGPSRHSHPTRVRDVRAGVCYPDFPGRRSVVRSKMFEHRRAAPPPNIRKGPRLTRWGVQ